MCSLTIGGDFGLGDKCAIISYALFATAISLLIPTFGQFPIGVLQHTQLRAGISILPKYTMTITNLTSQGPVQTPDFGRCSGLSLNVFRMRYSLSLLYRIWRTSRLGLTELSNALLHCMTNYLDMIAVCFMVPKTNLILLALFHKPVSFLLSRAVSTLQLRLWSEQDYAPSIPDTCQGHSNGRRLTAARDSLPQFRRSKARRRKNQCTGAM